MRTYATLLSTLAVLVGTLALPVGNQNKAQDRTQDKAQDKAQAARAQKPVSVFFLRHAETDGTKKRELSQTGQQRAAVLARLLAKAGVTHVFASEYARTQQTVAPLAAASGREPAVVKAQDAKELLRTLRALPAGSVAVVCGHSNTLPPLLARLGVPLRDLDERGHIAHDAHDRLLLVTLGAAGRVSPKCVELRLGAK